MNPRRLGDVGTRQGGDRPRVVTGPRGESGWADILVAGSPTLVRGLLGRELLDELNITILPIVVGSGDRLFPEPSTAEDLERLRLTLTSSTTLRSGALELQYARSAARARRTAKAGAHGTVSG